MLEKIWYESSPLVYLTLSFYGLLRDHFPSAFFAGILLGTTLLIITMRIQYRSKI
jgi:hypothetical protein